MLAPVPDPILRCAGLRKTFDERVAVADVGFEIAHGETYGLLGPNGAGKTTTISIGDRVVNDMPSKDRDVAMVFQNSAPDHRSAPSE